MCNWGSETPPLIARSWAQKPPRYTGMIAWRWFNGIFFLTWFLMGPIAFTSITSFRRMRTSPDFDLKKKIILADEVSEVAVSCKFRSLTVYQCYEGQNLPIGEWSLRVSRRRHLAESRIVCCSPETTSTLFLEKTPRVFVSHKFMPTINSNFFPGGKKNLEWNFFFPGIYPGADPGARSWIYIVAGSREESVDIRRRLIMKIRIQPNMQNVSSRTVGVAPFLSHVFPETDLGSGRTAALFPIPLPPTFPPPKPAWSNNSWPGAIEQKEKYSIPFDVFLSAATFSLSSDRPRRGYRTYNLSRAWVFERHRRCYFKGFTLTCTPRQTSVNFFRL